MSAKLPIIEQMQAAGDNRARADVLLRCPDSIVLKYAEPLTRICRRAGFEAGEVFVEERVAALLAVRGGAGELPGGVAMSLEGMRAELAAYAAGAPALNATAEPEWPLDAPQGALDPAGYRRGPPPD